MRIGNILLTLLVLVALCPAQSGPSSEVQADLLVLKYDWSKERINWAGDPFSVPNEGYSEMRDRVRNERRSRSALEERTVREIKENQKKPPKPPRYVFRYNLSVHNTSPKTIKEIDWDYLFTDAASGEILGRREFTIAETIGPTKKKKISLLASAAPAQTISVHSLGTNERVGLAEKVIIVRILYEDGSVWSLAN